MIDATLNYYDHGAQRFHGAVAQDLDDLFVALACLPQGAAGVRIKAAEKLRRFLTADGQIGAVATTVLGSSCRAVRAILFDKTAETNWSLAWHQDRTICVRRRIDVAGFGPWTRKDGMQHVAPPFDVLARMVTLRVHLDTVSATNAPLLIAPGSHLAGRVETSVISDVVRQCGTRSCLAEAGDVWLYATPILHASKAAAQPTRRRVLQIDFSAEQLPGGLEWLGV